MKTLRNIAILALTFAALAASVLAQGSSEPNGRWSKEKAWKWYNSTPWPVGCNYIPSTAINQLETWQADTFDPKTIDRELGWAAGLGFNTVRIFMHNLVWEQDPAGFKKRLGQFLDLCQKHGLRTIPTFFTNGCYGFEGEPKLGKQPAPQPGIHNSGWVQAPGAVIVNDPTKWGPLEKYVKDIVGSFAKDDRVLLWCLYNEPENTKKDAKSLPLMRKVFEWARSVNPSQPLSAPIWQIPGSQRTALDIVCFLGENCDVITFHTYTKPPVTKDFIRLLKAFDRPMICTEYMGRTIGNTFQDMLPLFAKERIGAMNFGLVVGKMNTHFPWKSPLNAPEPEVWFHDIFRKDGSPYDPAEVALIKDITSKGKTRP